MTSGALVTDADRCVACGLCVPLCPTYRKLRSEADSPRGRVMLIRALAEGSAAPTPGLVAHLERCLACRACEAACPSGVAYGALIDGARALLHDKGVRAPLPLTLLARVLSAQGWLDLSARLTFASRYAARGERRGAVALFLGCAARLMDRRTLACAIFVLTRLGYEVHVPRGQGCCGALAWQQGQAGRAHAQAERNLRAFASTDPMPVLFVASGCGARLAEYGALSAAGASFAARVQDVVSFLAAAEGWEVVDIAPAAVDIAVHEPCSARNVLKSAQATYRLLARVPGARVSPLAGNDQCCGAAGLYHLAQPTLAARLRTDKIEAAKGACPSLLVSANHGCARWLKQGLRKAGQPMEVLHPVSFLARQMGFTGAVLRGDTC
jgi:glycolate oxidase iron-sulfur subunit